MACRLRLARFSSVALVAALALSGLSGCDLLSDATAVTVCTDWEKVAVDTAQVGLTMTGQVVPDIPCTVGGADVCAQATAQLSCSGGGYECVVQCGSSAKCEVVATVEAPPTTIDLSSKIQSSLQASAIDKVTLSKVEYQVSRNSLNFNTPKISIFVGPNTAAKVGDAGVVRFATMPAIAAGATPSDALTPESAGQDALTGYVKNYKTPFKLLSNATLSFESGSPLPAGELQAQIRACFKVSAL